MASEHERSLKTPVGQFLAALHAGDVARVRELLEEHAEVRAAVNAPISDFDSRPLAAAKKNLPLVDVLLAHGADLNLKSAWWAGGFGLLEYGCTPEEAAPLIERGAIVDVFAASHLGMFERLRDLVDEDPSLVHARGGDGKTPLHCARTVEIAQYLIDRGADINARDVDHESTPAQYLVREAPDGGASARGARRVVRHLRRDRAARRGSGRALPARRPRRRWTIAPARASTPLPTTASGRRRARRSAIAAAISTGGCSATTSRPSRPPSFSATTTSSNCCCVTRRRRSGCLPRVRGPTAPPPRPWSRLIRAWPPASGAIRLRLIADKAHANDTAAVALMLDLGFDARVTGPDHADALHWAAFHGNTGMVRLLLRHDPPIGVREASYGGTPLDWCVHGSVHGWAKARGDFAATARLLLDAGERSDPAHLPTGRDDLDAILRASLGRA